MTIAPVAAPSAPPAPGSPSSGGGAAGEFDALVQQHLARDSEEPAGQSTPEATTESSAEETAAILEAACAPTAVRSDSLAALLAGMLAPVPAASGGAGTADAAGVDPDAAGAAPTGTALRASTGPVLGTGLPAGPGASTGVDLAAGSPVGGRSVVGDSTGLVPGGVDTTHLADTQAMAGIGEPRTSPAPAFAAGVDLAGSAAGAPTVASGDATSGNAMAGVLVTAPGSTAPGSAAVGPGGEVGPTVADPARGNPVTDQVFGQVTRLVSRGDGMHRLTLRLHPADLGEVKVVMTVKDGVVDVTLSAGAAAGEALREGSPQLRSLLEIAGATTGQLVVRELASTGSLATAANPQTGNPSGQHPGQAGPGNEQEGSFAPGTAGDNTDRRPGSRGSDGGGSAGTQRGTAGAARSVAGPDAIGRHPAGGPNPLTSPRLDLDL
jgi:hypothetical protein